MYRSQDVIALNVTTGAKSLKIRNAAAVRSGKNGLLLPIAAVEEIYERIEIL